jgi:magnesium chelatase subunit H
MPKHTTAADTTPVRVVIVTLDSHLSGSVERAQEMLLPELPGLCLSLHAVAEWNGDAVAAERCRADIAQADIVFASMLFMEEHIQLVLPSLMERQPHCDAFVGCMSAAEVIRLTRLGKFSMNGSQSGPLALLKRLRGGKSKGGAPGAQQMAMLRRIPKILRFIPGTAQDVRAYFLGLQYWLAGSEQNVANLVRFLIDRYADGPRRGLRGVLKVAAPEEYPEVGLYHPRLPGRIAEDSGALPAAGGRRCVGLLVMRSYVLAGNTHHYDGVIAALESRGLGVIPAFASGLDARPAVAKFFVRDGQPCVEAVVSLTGFSLVGGPAYNDARAAEEMLAGLDVPYLAAHPVEFQSLQQWQDSERGLLPVESTMMVAIPELDGAVGPIVFGGRTGGRSAAHSRDMKADPERVRMLAARVERLVALRHTERAQRRIAVVLFNFPPNSGGVGTAAHLSVFESLYNTLIALRDHGYSVEVPRDVEDLRQRILGGNASRHGTDANVHARIAVDDHVRREPWLAEIESQWGVAPGRQLSDGSGIHILGERFGNVFVGIQPAFGYEGDPMRLLFEKGFAPTHAFSAFYRFLKEDFAAHAVLHFGTHGALEFMPGKQVGLSQQCWPDRMIGDLPNIYLYAANNPSEGTLAKRRAAATLVSYLTPPLADAGLYRGLHELKASIERWRGLPPEAAAERDDLALLIQSQAAVLELAAAEPFWQEDSASQIAKLGAAVHEIEHTLIPHGLHVVGRPPSAAERVDLLLAMSSITPEPGLRRETFEALVHGASPEAALAATGAPAGKEALPRLQELAQADRLLARDHELAALLHALDGRFIRPVPGGDLLRTPAILPTGRNLHGFDPFRIPSAFAVADGAKQAQRLLARHCADGRPLPETVALVLWGTDNLKTEGGPIAQALALIGALPRFDGYGRLAGATLIPVEQLGRPRIDVVMTLSGIFRDLLPLQTRLLAEACHLAACADEPSEQNYVRKHALDYQRRHGCDLETAALRVFSNADGAYGSNVSHLINSSRWQDDDEIAETYSRRKCFAYGRNGTAVQQPELLRSVLSGVQLAYQNLDSVELGVTTLDHYFDTLGGISKAVEHASGTAIPVYIGDQTVGNGTVRTLNEQVALEARTRMLNPKWYEAMLEHGYEGVRHIEAHVTNTMGWSATTGQVAPWVYQAITQTFVLDPAMRERLASLNPVASARVASRLIEAHERHYWTPDPEVLETLRQAGEELEDRLEGINHTRVAA